MNKNKVIKIIKVLKCTYPEATCSLNFSNPFQMGIAVMLSAQCTDDRVNKITPELFEKYKTPLDYVNANIEDLEKIIYPCGFYKNKARNLKAYAEKIVDVFNGELPKTMEELVSLPGIGRKSANVIMLEAFNNPQGIAIDTHASRISNRLGLSIEKEPIKIEEDLLKIIPKEYYKDVNHLFVWHGRKTCSAKHPKCAQCTIKELCCKENKFKNNKGK